MSNKQLEPPQQPWETADYEDDPFELGTVDVARLKIVSKGFLPPLEALVKKTSQRKVTIVLDDYTIQAFKSKADELDGSYQALMRQLLLEYARSFEVEKGKELA